MNDGDNAVVECKGELFGGKIQLMTMGKWPDTREELHFVRPLFFPYPIKNGACDLGKVRIVK